MTAVSFRLLFIFWLTSTGNKKTEFKHCGWFMYFPSISNAIGNKGIVARVSVFCRLVYIHFPPSMPFDICELSSFFISENASPVKQQNRKISRIWSIRSIDILLFISNPAHPLMVMRIIIGASPFFRSFVFLMKHKMFIVFRLFKMIVFLCKTIVMGLF